MSDVREKKKIGLTGKIFIGLILGAVTGVIFHYLIPAGYVRDTIFVEGIFYVIGQGFLRLMQMLVVPLVFCSLICGSSAIGDTATLGKVGVKTLIFYLATTAIAITLAIGVGNVINPGMGLDVSNIEASDVTIAESTSFADTLLNIIPKNPIGALANGDMLPIILFAIIVGIILAKLGSRVETVSNFFAQFNDIMMEMTNMVMYVAPVGVFCLIARTFAGIGFSAFIPLLKYMLSVLLALLLHCFGTYMLMLKGFTGLSPVRFIKKFFPVMAFEIGRASCRERV